MISQVVTDFLQANQTELDRLLDLAKARVPTVEECSQFGAVRETERYLGSELSQLMNRMDTRGFWASYGKPYSDAHKQFLTPFEEPLEATDMFSKELMAEVFAMQRQAFWLRLWIHTTPLLIAGYCAEAAKQGVDVVQLMEEQLGDREDDDISDDPTEEIVPKDAELN